MKNQLFSAIILIVCSCFITTKVSAQDNNQSFKQLNRVLIFTFKPGIVSDSIKLVDNAYMEISKLPSIKSFEVGVVKSSEDEPKSVKHMYILGFTTPEGIETYVKTPQHDNLMNLAKSVVDFKIFDYWTD